MNARVGTEPNTESPARVYFAMALHAHQPVGNFGHVFEEHLADVYEPFLNRAVAGGLVPLTLHLSGPLLDWLETNATGYLDLIGTLVSDEKLELLLAGYYEPILPSLLREDRIEQIHWMQEALKSRFGVSGRGLWLTERVWEPDLAADLADAGVEYVLVDDRHFVAAGFSRDRLHLPFRTEFHGKSLAVFAIDEHLRYFLPFRPPQDTVDYLRKLRGSGHRLAVAADDIEKFGGWPGTKEWVYERGWLEDFTKAIKKMEEAEEVRLATFSQALADLPSAGTAYLPSSSYREMEEWALPASSAHRLLELKKATGQEGLANGESPLIRGSHWRNFLVKYSESNRMHKKALALSILCRERDNPERARRALGSAQCNDVYWHGVFGGLYLRHLRDTVWKKLAEAEGELRRGEELVCEQTDLDLDGYDELWVHSDAFSAIVSPRRGGAVEELTHFEQGVNLANTLTRRREAYHFHEGSGGVSDRGEDEEADRGDPESSRSADEKAQPALPPVDTDDRALFLDRILPGDLDGHTFHQGFYQPVESWARQPLDLLTVEGGTEKGPWLEICLGDGASGRLEKRLRFEADGTLEVLFDWDPVGFPEDAYFTTELSLGADAEVLTAPEASLWRFPIATFSKSERGFDETVQGESVTVRWPVTTGWGRVRLVRP
jgi:alpha-amylase